MHVHTYTQNVSFLLLSFSSVFKALNPIDTISTEGFFLLENAPNNTNHFKVSYCLMKMKGFCTTYPQGKERKKKATATPMNEELREAVNEEKICETRNDPE